MKSSLRVATVLACGLLLQPGVSRADSIFTVNTSTADAFLAAGSANNPGCGTGCGSLNFGGAGTLAIAPASSTKGQFDSVVQWNTAGAAAQFNAAFGAGNWQITSIALNLASNFGDQGEQPNNANFNAINAGQFNVQWISNNSWIEGTGSGMGTAPGNPPSVTFGNKATTLLSGTSAALGTFLYTPPGDNTYRSYNLALDPNLVNDVVTSGLTSLYFSAADENVGFLFNAKSYSTNHPQFIVTADLAPVPVPAALWLFGSGIVGLVGFARRKASGAVA
ncbi:VPLPA-CTERM sorting domain-containing protein [Nitrospira lenta]|uniref:VPLPA-CTERM protein sorting domain-containing protein n=1 Tax=Nitrospira lenta TaxID=1436998 RepID=A0A330L283_9BACT|nr:VPLPA-CTERM sorting domain-containing protein [Nitrospira lenta]SPP62952.1 conserved exported hypothetical protein [Nitrospira lenta]